MEPQEESQLNPNGVPLAHQASGHEVMVKALQTFAYIEENEYVGSADGLSGQDDHMKCQCQYNADVDDPEEACGEQCINRMVFVECQPKFCPVGEACRNQRFQRKQYSPVEIFQTASKGFGIQAKADIAANEFVIEYLGEVVSSLAFRKRTQLYEDEGIKHMYFMSLKIDEVIDATKRGGIARFINHSCNPNCVLQKWVVGKRLRMAIFTKRPIAAGEELSFDYKFVRYGAPPQVCLCGADNCKGTIGTTKSPILSNETGSMDTLAEEETDAMIEEDEDDDDERRRTGIEDPDRITHVVQVFLRSAEKPRRVNHILDRLLITESTAVFRKFVQLHGLLLLKKCLKNLSDHHTISRKILNLLQKMPITTRNTIEDSGIQPVVETFIDNKDTIIAVLARKLSEDWNKLETIYRIPKAPKRKQEQNDNNRDDNNDRDVKRTKSSEEGKRSSFSQNFQNRRSWSGVSTKSARSSDDARRQDRKGEAFSAPPRPLPAGWHYSHSPSGEIYYYNLKNLVPQWDFPNPPEKSLTGESSAGGSTPLIENPHNIISKMAEEARFAVEKARAEETLALQKSKKDSSSSSKKDKSGSKQHRSGSSSDLKKQNSKTKQADSEKAVNVGMKSELRDELAALVLKYFSKYKASLQPEIFKKHARKITHALIDKSSRDKEVLTVNDEFKRKIRKFVDAYTEKLNQRLRDGIDDDKDVVGLELDKSDTPTSLSVDTPHN